MCLHTLKCGALILVYLSSETHNARVSECTSSAFTSNIFFVNQPERVDNSRLLFDRSCRHKDLDGKYKNSSTTALLDLSNQTFQLRNYTCISSVSEESLHQFAFRHARPHRLRWLANILTVDWVWVPAPTAGSCDSVIAALAHRHTSFSWEVAQETGEEQGQERHRGPADATVRLRAREGLVCARVLVVAGAVVEKPLDAANTRPVLHRTLRWANAPPATHPAGGQHPWATTLWTLTPATVLTSAWVFSLIFIGSAARHGHHRPGLIV